MDGQVCITNTGTHDTRGLAGTIDLTAPPDTTPITTTALDVSTEQVIPAGQGHCYPYRVDFPSASPPTPGHTYQVTANVTITNFSGRSGPFGPSPTADAVMGPRCSPTTA
jgi:hypothetical protein